MTASVSSLIERLANFTGDYWGLEAREKEAVAEVKTLSIEEQVEFVLLGCAIVANRLCLAPMILSKALSAVLRRKLPFTPEQVLHLVVLGENPSYYFPFVPVCGLVESQTMTPDLAAALRSMANATVLRHGQVQGHRQIVERITEMIGGVKPFEPAGTWTRSFAAEIDPAWTAVLEAGRDLSPEASKKWQTAAAKRVEGIGPERFRVTALRWLALGPYPDNPGGQVDAKESDYQRGLIWSLVPFPDAEMCAAVARFAEECFRKIPMIGAVSHKSGNACVRVLAAMNGMTPVSQLSRLATRIKYSTAQRLVQEALDEAATRQGISREELEEMAAPTMEGSPKKDVEKMLIAQRIRIERLLLSQRSIPLTSWREYYIDHPLIAGMSRRLIWQFESGETALYRDGRMLSWDGSEVAPSGSVRLWHPINSDVQTILNWRCRLEDDQIQQPFKQAHREVYIITDAERETSTYSNRFAGHILKQHQFAALCDQRGWKFNLMGQWDSHNTPYADLPQFGLRVEYLVDFPADEAVSGHAIYLYLATDQLRFVDIATGMPRKLETIPPVIFSELMRDVDLFVGVASIGNDPMWGARDDAPFGHYWGEMSFGELSVAASQRRDILSRLIPKLPIANRCRIDERFLHVRGDLAQYKIHVGSGNVMMEPGSRYLCIVRGPSKGGAGSKVFLPFEGDGMLSLILSKAFMLAADRKITDPTITRQLPI